MIILIFLILGQYYPVKPTFDLPDFGGLKVVTEERMSADFYAQVGMKLIKIYQQSFSLAQGDVCNFIPSCSHFGYESLKEFGFVKGLLLTSDRLQRCHPFSWRYVNYYGVAFDSIRGKRLYDPPKRYR